MIRRGIYKENQLFTKNLKDSFGREKNISLYLYSKISHSNNHIERSKLQELILNRFNSEGNIIKRTYKNRFNNFDDSSIKAILEQRFKSTSVLDVGISDGRASYYFLETSAKKIKNLSYTGSDINISYFLNKINSKRRSYVITDIKNTVIEITKPPFVWNYSRTEGKLYIINNILKKYYLKRAKLALLNNKYKYKEQIELIHDDFKLLLSGNPNYEICNYNLFEVIPVKYSVIRAMNILHYGYFNQDQLASILINVFNGLELHGLFIEGSNESEGSEVEGAIYKKSENGFVLLGQPEKPSRIIEMVLSFVPVIINE